MKKQKKEKPYIEELIKEESSAEYHSESFGNEGNRICITAIASFPSDYCYIAIQSAYSLCHLKHTLIVADAVGYGEGNFRFVIIGQHGDKNTQTKGIGERANGRKGENIYFYKKKIG